MVLLPVCWLTEMTPEVLEAVVAHELAHVRRWDLWVNLFQRLVETLLFYHPAVWWVSRRVRLEREMCCDELAVSVTGERLVVDVTGLRLRVRSSWGEGELASPLLGRFNAANLLAVLAVLLESGVALDAALARVGALRTVSGRMERLGGGDQPVVVVDYAHTPDALAQVLGALREHCAGRLSCVFGCGGERDRGKRSLMGEVAETLADRVVVTDDNPRHEDGDGIVAEILAGLREPGRATVERNRARAIALAVGEALPGDIVLVAGKGHEPYQQVGDLRLPFSDRAVVRGLLQGSEAAP
jgi:UDP-N-acetylmuramoyl-L-alanyl-D-glutamate--2,6-diaminopimelate ligase